MIDATEEPNPPSPPPSPDSSVGVRVAAPERPVVVEPRPIRIALAHDWLCGYRGGEAVLERIALALAPTYRIEDLYVLFDDRQPVAPAIDALRHVASPLQHVPGGPTRMRRWLLPAYPTGVARLGAKLRRDHDKNPIDLLISTSSAAIKGLRPPPGAAHLCYCHSPARYVWHARQDYAGRGFTGRLRSAGLTLASKPYRAWDRATAKNVTRFLANSHHTADQIRHCFGRDSHVVHPPVRTDLFTPDPTLPREDFWLVVSALEPYKRVDLAIAAAKRAGHTLLVAGDGSQRRQLEADAGDNVRFLGRVSGQKLVSLYRRARVLLFPQVEDFGIVAVEAQACGLPVVARRAGGALDTLIEDETGVFFDAPTPRAVIDAVARAPMPGDACRANAVRFSESAFDDALRRHVHEVLDTKR